MMSVSMYPLMKDLAAEGGRGQQGQQGQQGRKRHRRPPSFQQPQIELRVEDEEVPEKEVKLQLQANAQL